MLLYMCGSVAPAHLLLQLPNHAAPQHVTSAGRRLCMHGGAPPGDALPSSGRQSDVLPQQSQPGMRDSSRVVP